jgi:hypothetical protein
MQARDFWGGSWWGASRTGKSSDNLPPTRMQYGYHFSLNDKTALNDFSTSTAQPVSTVMYGL